MRRFSPELFRDLRWWSVGLGLTVGLVFPFGMLLLGVPTGSVLHWRTLLASVAAGAGVGWLHFRVAQELIRPELQRVVHHLQSVQEQLGEGMFTGRRAEKSDWRLPVTTADELGEMAATFNGLVDELVRLQNLEQVAEQWTAAISSRLDLQSLGDTVLAEMIEHLKATAGVVLVREGEELLVAANHGLATPERLAGSAQVRRALASDRLRMVRVPPEAVIEGAVVDFRPAQVMIMPVVHGEQRLGAVVLASEGMFSKDAMWLAGVFKRGLGLALNNALAHERMQRLAAVDPLTGAFNRRFGMQRLHEESAKAARMEQPVTVVMFDIDHFKRVNDTYGHLVGDRVLKQVVATARATLRDSDILVRYGGEEFVAVLPGVDRETGRRIAERIRTAVAESDVEYEDGTFRVTISLGVATIYPHGEVMDEDVILKQADDALYAAKENGRNRVVCQGDTIAESAPADAAEDAATAQRMADAAPAPDPTDAAPAADPKVPAACILP